MPHGFDAAVRAAVISRFTLLIIVWVLLRARFSFRLRDMLDTPLQTGTARHVLLGETATALDAETSFTVFDLLEGMGWELGFQGGSLTCNLKE